MKSLEAILSLYILASCGRITKDGEYKDFVPNTKRTIRPAYFYDLTDQDRIEEEQEKERGDNMKYKLLRHYRQAGA